MKKFLSIILSFAFCLALVHGKALATDAEPKIIINAINPGYTVDGRSNVGEFIELRKLGDEDFLLTGFSIKYTNSSGTKSTVFEFPDDSKMTGETLLLRLASAPDAELADATYTKTLAFSAGPLELAKSDEVVDSLCWTGKDDCYTKFTSANPTSLVRNLEDDTFYHDADYEPLFDKNKPSLVLKETVDEMVTPKCRSLEFSEILSYFETSKSEQFVEIYNRGDEQVLLDGCSLRYKNKTYPLNGILKAGGYLARYATDFTLTKNPTSENKLEIIDTDGVVVDTLVFYNGQKRGVAFAQFGYGADGKEQWKQTYAPTPGEANNFQEFQSCPEGKVLNKETGNCVKATTLSMLKECPAGQYRNPLSGRCKSYNTSSNSTAKPCPEGYERNPETGRCRKVVNNSGADYELSVDEYKQETSFIALWAILGVVVAGLLYIAFQFRAEIKKLGLKILKIFSRKHKK
ncbi:hypothetical protein IJI94_01060 [Candidatus Saccharibacteria bacterium]|nr:hypothetical protein [Candidatus Saccharibacteria bacterium]